MLLPPPPPPPASSVNQHGVQLRRGGPVPKATVGAGLLRASCVGVLHLPRPVLGHQHSGSDSFCHPCPSSCTPRGTFFTLTFTSSTPSPPHALLPQGSVLLSHPVNSPLLSRAQTPAHPQPSPVAGPDTRHRPSQVSVSPQPSPGEAVHFFTHPKLRVRRWAHQPPCSPRLPAHRFPSTL